ncbi:MAG: hydroxymethylglutaryl-CoA lyase [Bacteriovoracaceae bacterium]|jgi:hydroxymethylglutaryl-CoA lyase|nr:hydroxymethylglutaryl-CoA lyase [Halobacteriovoraceae bacterium]MDP7320980.1 hydroxymethylglutaryl-CoA lyase [Bacteriovoracaceae bacterium]
MFTYNDSKIKIVEVGPRDGLQNEKISLQLEDKMQYISLLAQAGLQTIEATSFVRADKIPQMADAKELFLQLKKQEYFHHINFPCLVPNRKGYEAAKAVGVREISLFSATSDEFSLKNINCTVDESFKRMQEVATLAKEEGIKIRGYISTAFGCPYAGDIGVKKLVEVIEKFEELGVYEISIGDTIGVGTPKQVDDYLKEVLKVISVEKIAMHFHDTRGMALSNILVSLEHGVSVFDSSSGGLGGCPYAKGATGNVATEDIYYLLNSLGLVTNLDLNKLYLASKFILEKVQKQSPSKFFQILEQKQGKV